MKRFILLLSLIFLLPVQATTLNGQVEQADLSGQVDQSSLRIQRGQSYLTGQTQDNLLRSSVSDTMPPTAPRRLYPLTPNSDNRTYPPDSTHGQRPMGVLGALVSHGSWINSPEILQIFPASDLKNFDVRVGDKIVKIDGHHILDQPDLQRRVIGIPGTIMNLTITRNGEKRIFQIKRVDARSFLNCESSFSPNHYHKVAAMTKYW